MRRVAIQAVLCIFCLGLVSQAAEAKKRVASRDRSTAAPYWLPHPQFTDAEVRLVLNWFQDAFEAGKRPIVALPAAVTAQIRVGTKLTASAVKCLASPPAELVAKLPPLPDGYERMLAGPVLVIVKTDEELIVDTLSVLAR